MIFRFCAGAMTLKPGYGNRLRKRLPRIRKRPYLADLVRKTRLTMLTY